MDSGDRTAASKLRPAATIDRAGEETLGSGGVDGGGEAEHGEDEEGHE